MLKTARKIGKVISWIGVVLRILIAVKKILNGGENGPIDISGNGDQP